MAFKDWIIRQRQLSASLSASIAGFATTGSNIFYGNQVISGSLFVSGSVTAYSFTGSITTASYAFYAETASYINGGTF